MSEEVTEERSRGGRPTDLTPELKARILQVIRQGNYRSVACRHVGIPEARFSLWMKAGKEDPDSVYGQFRKDVLEVEALAETEALGFIARAARAGDWKASAWWLARKFPERWGDMRGEVKDQGKRIAELEKQAAVHSNGRTP